MLAWAKNITSFVWTSTIQEAQFSFNFNYKLQLNLYIKVTLENRENWPYARCIGISTGGKLYKDHIYIVIKFVFYDLWLCDMPSDFSWTEF